MTAGHWGCPAEETADQVQVLVPAELADAVAAMIQDPEGFVESVQRPEPVGIRMIEVDRLCWINPDRLAAIQARNTYESNVHLVGAEVIVEGTPEEVLQRISEKLSDPGPKVSSPPEGAPGT